jgi:outer membrane murein-binding lipoprotein Lpp
MPVAQFPSLSPRQGVEHGGNDSQIPPDMNERLGRIEGEISGLKHGHAMTLGGLGLVAALVTIGVAAVIGFGVYELQRIDQLSEKVNELPGKISADLRDLTKTLAQSITAAKQQPPQVILIPTPQQSPSPPKP